MKIEITLTGSLIIVTVFSIIQFLSATFIKAELEKSIAAKYDKVLEDYRYNLKVRERAEKVAEYIALQTNLKEGSPQNEYDRINRLGFELSMCLPADVYRKLAHAAVSRTLKERLEVIIEIRKLLLGDKAGDLTSNDVLYAAPGIGKHR